MKDISKTAIEWTQLGISKKFRAGNEPDRYESFSLHNVMSLWEGAGWFDDFNPVNIPEGSNKFTRLAGFEIKSMRPIFRTEMVI